MHLKKPINSRSIKDFLGLFLSNIFQKLLGLIREPIIAYFFGSSLIYANYLLLRTGADFLAQFSVGNALKANLLPKFSKIFSQYHEITLGKVYSFSKRFMFWIFIISQLVQSLIILIINPENKLLFFTISIVLSFDLCFNFLNSVYLTILQAMGRFMRFSVANTLNAAISTALMYPLVLVSGLFGLVLSRLFGILSIVIGYVLPMNKNHNGYELELQKKDFNLPILFLGNFANIIIITTRFISGSDGSNNITYYTYSVFILNAILTAVVGNISTLLLRKVSIKKSDKAMFLSLCVSIVVGVSFIIFSYFFGYDFIKLIFLRGKFNMNDVYNTSSYLFQLSFSFLLIFIATTIFQPFFSLEIDKAISERKNIFLCFLSFLIICLVCLSFIDYDIKTKSLIYIYIMSFLSVILSIKSYFVYTRNVS